MINTQDNGGYGQRHLHPNHYGGIQVDTDILVVLGEMKMFAGSNAPKNWKICDGETLLISENQDLFNVIGNNFGGDGITDFKLPDMRGRAAIGAGQGESLTVRNLGDKIGSETHVLLESEIPPHNHNPRLVYENNQTGEDSDASLIMTSGSLFLEDPIGVPQVRSVLSDNIGSGTPHNIIQPSLTINYIIRVA